MYDIQDNTVGVLRYIHVRTVAAGPNFTDIRNNFFSMLSGNASLVDIAMIELEGSTAANARVVNNSFRVGGVQTANGTSGNVCSAALHISNTSAASTYEIKNNLFVNERTGGTTGVQHVCLRIENASPTFNIDYNTYNSMGDLVRWGATAYNTLTAYQAVVPGR